MRAIPLPVSYTHLDVYKRQVLIMVCSRVRIRSGDASLRAWVRTLAGSTIEAVVIGAMPFRVRVRRLLEGVPGGHAVLIAGPGSLHHSTGHYFDHPRTSNGPTEAINGRLEHLRGSALGFRNLTHYIARSLLEAGGFRPRCV